MYVCEFGQNPSTDSEDNAWKPYFGIQSTYSLSPTCIYASLVKIHPLVQKITHGHHILDISK